MKKTPKKRNTKKRKQETKKIMIKTEKNRKDQINDN